MAATVTGLFLWDILKKQDITSISDGQSIVLSDLPVFSIRAEVSGAKSVSFLLSNRMHHVERFAPFVSIGDDLPLHLAEGIHRLTVVPYSSNDATSGKGEPLTIRFTVSKEPLVPSILKGICGGLRIPIKRGLPIFRDLGVGGIRHWLSFDETKVPDANIIEMMREYHTAGIKIVACCANVGMKAEISPSKVKDWFKRAVDLSDGCVDAWELGNEVNVARSYLGTPEQWVGNFMKPAYGVLKDAHQTVYGTPMLTRTSDLGNFIAVGYLDFCDVVCHHPYKTNVSTHIDNVRRAKSLIGQKPLVLTEWNIFGYMDSPKMTDQQWAGSLKPMLDGIRGLIEEVYYVRAFQKQQMGSEAGILLDSPQCLPNEPFYSAFKGL